PCISLSVTSARHTPDLHSFPTRRSSDLRLFRRPINRANAPWNHRGDDRVRPSGNRWINPRLADAGYTIKSRQHRRLVVMLAVHARYRGRAVRRAELVERSAAALSTLDGVGEFEFLGVEDICAKVDTATAVCEVAMALLADGSWAISIGISHDDAKKTATRGLK